MALQLGGVAVGAMQFGGVTIGEAMIDGKVVYRSTIYPVEGSWGPVALTADPVTYASHTIAEAGTFTITHNQVGGGNPRTAAIKGPWGTANSPLANAATTATVATTQTLNPGDVIEFQAIALPPSGTGTGNWSIVKN